VSANEGESKGHIAALDGLRAVAIILVLARHSAGDVAWPQTTAALRLQRAMLAGWMGVDVFFVLSGFLITGILVDARGDGPRAPAGYFRAFYARRALRIFPLYYLFLAGAFLVQRASAPHGTWWYWAYLSNELFARYGFGAVSHVWSLAVEEQFYLIWPAVIWLVPPRRLAAVAWGMVVSSAVLRGFIATHWPAPAAYVLTDCRLDEFAAGALLALHLRTSSITDGFRRGARVALCATAMAAIVVRGVLPFTGNAVALQAGASLSMVATAAAIALALRRTSGGTVSYLLRLAPLRSLGRYSYAIYLVHEHVGHVVRHWRARWSLDSSVAAVAVQTLATLAISWAVGWVSWRVLERPLLSLKRFVPMPTPGRDARMSAQVAGQPAIE